MKKATHSRKTSAFALSTFGIGYTIMATLFACLLMTTGCSLPEPQGNTGPDDSATADMIRFIADAKAAGNDEAGRWNGTPHKNLAQFGCEMFGIGNSSFWNYADDPDSFTGGDDEGFANGLLPVAYPGKPGHAFFWEYDGGWKHVAPYTSWAAFGSQHWADYNVHKWMDKARASFNANDGNVDKYLGYILHYMADMGVPYHVYWNGSIYGTIYQWLSHSDYENAVANNWTSGKKFLGMLGSTVWWDDIYNASDDKHLVRNFSQYMAKNFNYVVSTIGTGSINFNNTDVYRGTMLSLSCSADAVASTLLWAAKNFGVLRSKAKKYGVCSTKGSYIYADVYAAAGDKIYCGANWRSSTNSDYDIGIFYYSGGSYIGKVTSTSATDDPETLSYVVPTTGTYRIITMPDTPTSAQVGLNAMVVRKHSNTYMFD
jgi:hypothetical protein